MVEVKEVGLIDYPAIMNLFSGLLPEATRGHETILLATHPPTITLGRRTQINEVLIPRWKRIARGIGLFYTNRGGGATFHGPDQEVVYPVLCLECRHLPVPVFIRLLGSTVINTLKGLGIEAQWDDSRPGVYVEGKKVASIGLRIHRGVVFHGMSINVGSSQEGFRLIHPCKDPHLQITSLQDLLDKRPPRWEVGREVIRHLLEELGQFPYRPRS